MSAATRHTGYLKRTCSNGAHSPTSLFPNLSRKYSTLLSFVSALPPPASQLALNGRIQNLLEETIVALPGWNLGLEHSIWP